MTCMALAGVLFLAACNEEEDGVEAPDCSVNGVPTLSLTSKVNASCGLSNGSAALEATGGDGALEFSIDGGQTWQTEASFGALSAGTYTAQVRDGVGCSFSTSFVIDNFAELDLTPTVVNASCGDASGSITVNVNGSGSYEYRIGEGDFQANNVFENLAAGEYFLEVRGSDCSFSSNVRVGTGVSLLQDISPILNTKCAYLGCHNTILIEDGDTSVVDSIFPELIVQFGPSVEYLTTLDIMPPEGFTDLTPEEKSLIDCWVRDGTPDN